MDSFKKQLAVKLLIAVLVVGAAITTTEIISGALKKEVAKIETRKQELALRAQATDFLAALKADFEKAKPLLDLLASVLPVKDNLVDLGQKMRDLAKRFNIELDFNFGPETSSAAGKPGSITFSLTGVGSYENIVRLLKEIEKSPLYTKTNSLDLTRKSESDKFSFVINGEVFYQ